MGCVERRAVGVGCKLDHPATCTILAADLERDDLMVCDRDRPIVYEFGLDDAGLHPKPWKPRCAAFGTDLWQCPDFIGDRCG